MKHSPLEKALTNLVQKFAPPGISEDELMTQVLVDAIRTQSKSLPDDQVGFLEFCRKHPQLTVAKCLSVVLRAVHRKLRGTFVLPNDLQDAVIPQDRGIIDAINKLLDRYGERKKPDQILAGTLVEAYDNALPPMSADEKSVFNLCEKQLDSTIAAMRKRLQRAAVGVPRVKKSIRERSVRESIEHAGIDETIAHKKREPDSEEEPND